MKEKCSESLSKSSESLAAILSLAQIGQVLDSGQFPCATAGGVILPDSPSSFPNESGKEYPYVRSREPEAKFEQERATGWEGATNRSREVRRTPAADSTPSHIVPRFSEKSHVLAAVAGAYPGAVIPESSDSEWIFVPTRLFPGTKPRAYFICNVNYNSGGFPKTWAFWPDHSWIGPRHTNFPDGSICAFHISDGTWNPGDSWVTLFDLYSLWVVRHLHLNLLGWWPGEQVATIRYERLIELEPNERCGCLAPKGSYAACCRPKDILDVTLAEAIQFNVQKRYPPADVIEFRNSSLVSSYFRQLGFNSPSAEG